MSGDSQNPEAVVSQPNHITYNFLPREVQVKIVEEFLPMTLDTVAQRGRRSNFSRVNQLWKETIEKGLWHSLHITDEELGDFSHFMRQGRRRSYLRHLTFYIQLSRGVRPRSLDEDSFVGRTCWAVYRLFGVMASWADDLNPGRIALEYTYESGLRRTPAAPEYDRLMMPWPAMPTVPSIGSVTSFELFDGVNLRWNAQSLLGLLDFTPAVTDVVTTGLDVDLFSRDNIRDAQRFIDGLIRRDAGIRATAYASRPEFPPSGVDIAGKPLEELHLTAKLRGRDYLRSLDGLRHIVDPHRFHECQPLMANLTVSIFDLSQNLTRLTLDYMVDVELFLRLTVERHQFPARGRRDWDMIDDADTDSSDERREEEEDDDDGGGGGDNESISSDDVFLPGRVEWAGEWEEAHRARAHEAGAEEATQATRGGQRGKRNPRWFVPFWPNLQSLELCGMFPAHASRHPALPKKLVRSLIEAVPHMPQIKHVRVFMLSVFDNREEYRRDGSRMLVPTRVRNPGHRKISWLLELDVQPCALEHADCNGVCVARNSATCNGHDTRREPGRVGAVEARLQVPRDYARLLVTGYQLSTKHELRPLEKALMALRPSRRAGDGGVAGLAYYKGMAMMENDKVAFITFSSFARSVRKNIVWDREMV
ncbi:hypothetical protein BD289DRAFT_476425 [Coniella lustricola]|uniref:Uncharacterized protein n=1 Tax=Coniella lustricola TaxID=2025994 RepID=A0A2T2ZYU3_9PEZI|nr:hypothetical protein BD289DRAFT_476425 [Coniella lustricola]